jgi:hypothetical protein
MRMVDPTLPRYGTDLMTLQFELLPESSLAFGAASLIHSAAFSPVRKGSLQSAEPFQRFSRLLFRAAMQEQTVETVLELKTCVVTGLKPRCE